MVRFGQRLAVTLLGCIAATVSIASDPPTPGKPFKQGIEGTTVSFDLVWVPGERNGEGVWVSRTEMPWDVYDVFTYALDRPNPDTPADGVARPTKPYVTMDRGFGHAGFPAMSMSFKNAQAFCDWLSAKSGLHYRLPTEAEWERLCDRGAKPALEKHPLDHLAWHDGNAGYQTRAVGSKAGDALGLHDLLGNVAEWCVTADGKGVARGGSYRDEPEIVRCDRREEPSPAWNASDPQIPKSVWWLADCPWVGVRVICDPKPKPAPEADPAERSEK